MIKFLPYSISKQSAVFSIIRFLYVVLLICSNYSTFAQWQQTLGPASGVSTALYAKGDTLFAGNFEHYYTLANTNPKAGTLYRSLDHGQRWFRDSTGFYGVPNAFAHNGSTVFVSTSTDGIFRSLDNGSTWSSLQGTNALSPEKLLYVNGILYVGRVIDGVSLSTDN